MDTCHLLLGRLWKFDKSIIHDGKKNTYNFVVDKTKIVLLPSKEVVAKTTTVENNNLLAKKVFGEEMDNNCLDYMLIGNKCESGRVIPKVVQALIDKKHSFLEFEVGDFVWAVLTKDHCPVGEFSKLAGE